MVASAGLSLLVSAVVILHIDDVKIRRSLECLHKRVVTSLFTQHKKNK